MRAFLDKVPKWGLRFAISLAIALVLGEIGLRIYIRQSPTWSAFAKSFRADPITGFGMSPNVSKRVDIEHLEYHFTLDTNAEGFRGPVVAPRQPGECRLLVIGDSFAYGIGVEKNETFPALLEARLRETLQRPVSVINTGVPSFGTVQELALYRARGPAFDPDAVLLAFFDNDFEDNLSHFEYVDGFLFRDPVLIAGHASFVLELVLKRVLHMQGAPGDVQERAKSLFSELRDLAAERHHPLLVARIPDRERTKFALYTGRSTKDGFPEVPGLQSYDLRPPLETAPTTPFLRDHHLNKLGHRITTEALLPWALEMCRSQAAASK